MTALVKTNTQGDNITTSLIVAHPPLIVDLGFEPGRAPPLGNVEVVNTENKFFNAF